MKSTTYLKTMHLKSLILVLISTIMLVSCVQKESKKVTAKGKSYNPALMKILQAHGGIDDWNRQQTLTFTMGDQTHTIDLHSREVKITSPGMSMGNDEGTVWLKQDSAHFQGSPTFYHSLMFYFHTMPFVFADDGINYEEGPNKTFKSTEYKSLKMSFDAGVGDAPKDEYILYYHPDTYKMEWLAYTSTYRAQEKSDDFGLIHYKTWEETNGFLLPTELQWFQYKNGEAGEASGNPRTFTNVSVSEKKMGDGFFAIPEGAEVDSAGMN